MAVYKRLCIEFKIGEKKYINIINDSSHVKVKLQFLIKPNWMSYDI